MVEDDRGSRRPNTETLSVSANSSSSADVLSLSDNETFQIEWIKIEYSSSGSTEGKIELNDDPTGTSAGDLSSPKDSFLVRSSDRIILDNPVYGSFESGIVLNPDGNHDAEVIVTIGGYFITQ